MSFPILPTVSGAKTAAIDTFSVVGQVLVPLSAVTGDKKHFARNFPHEVAVFVDARQATNLDQIVDLLNIGVSRVVVNETTFDEALDASLPSYRFIVDGNITKVTDTDASVIVREEVDIKSVSKSGNKPVYIEGDFTQKSATAYAVDGYTVVIDSTKLTTTSDSTTSSTPDAPISIADVFTSTLTTDRPDGLFTTLICGPAPAYTALGVVYSSEELIRASIAERAGVYQSRKRREELWYKGKTSGATQKLLKVQKDCDNDVVKFVVEQKAGSGFCHLDKNYTCFQDAQLYEDAPGHGLAKLDATLQSRLENAPEGSYTRRLFTDESLLIAKMREELDELIEAGQKKDRAEVAWEAADLVYFVMAWAAKHGVSLADVEKNLDVKSLRVTRRKGDAKEAYKKKEETKKEVQANSNEESQTNSFTIETIKVTPTNKSEVTAKALTRPVQKTADIMKLVLPIIDKVKKDGDRALVELTSKFDGVNLDSPVLNAPFPEELMSISDDMKAAIDLSMRNIEKFHAAQMPKEEIMTVETASGVFCSRFAKPIENVGLYVPGGTAVLPSTAMMLGVPAKVAGCKNIVVALPPARATGKLTPEVVYVAHKLGAKCIVMAGGAQAVTAMAYGTESVLKCDKILGPGNQFVTAAKMYVQNDTQALCSIDMPAGPSEVLVIADGKADADFVASDLLSQAEHGVDSQVILIGVGLSDAKVSEFNAAIAKQAAVLPRRDIVAKCLSHSYTLLVDNYEEAFELSNAYAPEHLILQVEDAEKFVPGHIENAGSVFVGALSPESCGDYSSGTNHTLPTYGYARQYSGVNTATFQKFITSQNVTEKGLRSIGKAVMTLAAVEGLEAHRNAVQVRMDKLGLS